MTIANIARKVERLGDGVSTLFDVPFQFLAAGDLAVAARNAAGVATPLELGVDYTVGGGDGATGSVLLGAAPATGTTIVITGAMPISQPTAYTPGGVFPAASHERALDRATIAAQENAAQVRDMTARALLVREGDAAPALPALADLTDRVLGYDGTQFVAVPNTAVAIAQDLVRAETAASTAQFAADEALQAQQHTEALVATQPVRVPKSNDTSVISSTVLAADPELFVPLGANSLTVLRGRINYSAALAGDLKLRLSGPAAASVQINRRAILPTATAYSGIAIDTDYSGSDIVLDGSAGSGLFEFDATIRNGAAAGNFTVNWAQNTSSATATILKAGSYIEYLRLPQSADFAFANTAIAKLGGFNASFFSGHNFMGQPGYASGLGNSYIETIVNGTALFVQVLAGNYTVQIDGAAPSVITAPAGWTFVSLFSGLEDSPHRVKIKGPYIEADTTFRVIGTAPSLSRPPDVPNYYPVTVAPYSGYIAIEGAVTNQGLYAAGDNQYSWALPSGCGLRFAATTTSVRLWTYNGGCPIVLLQDGIEVATVLPATSDQYQIVTLWTGPLGTHEYEIQFISVSQSVFVGGILVDTLVATAHAPREVDAYFGDSIVQGNALPSQLDARIMDPYILAKATGRVSTRRGGSGAKVSPTLRDLTSWITSLASVPTRVFVTAGANDMFQSVPVPTFQADYTTLLANMRAGLPAAKIYARAILPVASTATNSAARPSYNAAIAAAVAARVTAGDTNVVYIDTDGWIIPATDTVEGVHPNASGYAKIAAAQQLVL
ncbi:MAG: GDSL-type esterase/lipase family protein [Pseudomonadota bacterium]